MEVGKEVEMKELGRAEGAGRQRGEDDGKIGGGRYKKQKLGFKK
jgi:hypothetical protein